MSSHIKIGISTIIQEKCKAKMSKETGHYYEQLHELKAIWTLIMLVGKQLKIVLKKDKRKGTTKDHIIFQNLTLTVLCKKNLSVFEGQAGIMLKSHHCRTKLFHW